MARLVTPLSRLLPLYLAWAGAAGAQDAFEAAALQREAARQRAFERGQRTELPAREQRDSIGRLDDAGMNSGAVREGPPAASAYNRVMEAARHFRHHYDPRLRNVNDTFTADPALRAVMEREARRLYPALAQPGSAFARRQAAIDRWIDSRSPPLARDARRMLLVAHMVSLELDGRLRPDDYGLGQIPAAMQLAGAPGMRPLVARQGSFEIEVRGTQATLPGGVRGTVTPGENGMPDLIRWLDAEGGHRMEVPQEPQGIVLLGGGEFRRYQRLPGLAGGYRLRFSRP